MHELSHAVFDLMLYIGLELTDQEAFCYLLEFLVEQCVDIFAIRMDRFSPPSMLEDEVQSS